MDEFLHMACGHTGSLNRQPTKKNVFSGRFYVLNRTVKVSRGDKNYDLCQYVNCSFFVHLSQKMRLAIEILTNF